ncbi:MAG: STAS domain-containing protein [Acidimicrobiia bacterium]
MAEVEVQQTGEIVVVRLVGEVDLSNVETVRTALLEPVGHETESLIVDLGATQYLDSTGIRMLFDVALRLHARRQNLRLVVSDETIVRRVLVLTKLDQSVPFDRSVDAALAACERMEKI